MSGNGAFGGIFSGTSTQFLAAVSGTLFAISDGMCYGWTAPMIPYLISPESHISTTKHEAEYLETFLMAGSVFGLPLTIYLVNKIGRKRSMLLAASTSLLCWFAIVLSTKMRYLFITRFVFGVSGNMAFVAAPMYVAEIADQKVRGFLSSIIYLMMLVGFVIVYSVGPYAPFYAVPIIGMFVLLTDIILFSFMPESPYYLLEMNRNHEAEQSLAFLRPERDVEDELEDISKALQRQKSEIGGFRDIFMISSNRKAIIIMFILNCGQHMCAISVILMNLHLILEAGDSIYMDTNLVAIIFAVIMLISTQFASFQVDKYGRKALLIISCIITAICLLSLAIYFHLKLIGYDVLAISWIPIAAVIVYAAGFKFGLGIVPIVITAEIFPSKVKALCMTISDAWYVCGAILSIQMYQWLSNSYGLHVPFYIFSVCALLVCVFTVFYIPETSGRTLEEIQFILKGQYKPIMTKSYSGNVYNTFVNTG